MKINIPLVNANDEVIGEAEKMEVHLQGMLHRAFSILIFNSEGKMLIHQRAMGKYHSAGLWTNACCGHPFVNENTESAAERRLAEEMGIQTKLYYSHTFSYFAELENGLKENEIDSVFFGSTTNSFIPSPDEVMNYQWIDKAQLLEKIKTNPEDFTVWFKIIMTQPETLRLFDQF